LIDEGYIKKNRVHFNKSGKFANNIYTLVFWVNHVTILPPW
jgi:hypothetical protein